jgi:peptidoglycan-associated lipoprotein
MPANSSDRHREIPLKQHDRGLLVLLKERDSMRPCSRFIFSSAAFAAGLLLVACNKPNYPKCETDEHCKEKGEVCVNGQCQECREAKQCADKHGANYECVTGRCESKPECRADGDCTTVGAGLVCRSSKCVPECAANEDCPSGKKCDSKKCVAECSVDVDCGPNRSCVNGSCQDRAPEQATKISAACRPMNATPGQVVAVPTVRFEFDKFDLTVEARSDLDRAAQCLREAPQVVVVLEGHADERGTQEYNLALGEKRATSVRGYLRNLGVETARLQTRSKGKNEPVCSDPNEGCWSKNRRVEFLQAIK